eukprot:108877-Chlamydomonas_euryale.AAC.1
MFLNPLQGAVTEEDLPSDESALSDAHTLSSGEDSGSGSDGGMPDGDEVSKCESVEQWHGGLGGRTPTSPAAVTTAAAALTSRCQMWARCKSVKVWYGGLHVDCRGGSSNRSSSSRDCLFGVLDTDGLRKRGTCGTTCGRVDPILDPRPPPFVKCPTPAGPPPFVKCPTPARPPPFVKCPTPARPPPF